MGFCIRYLGKCLKLVKYWNKVDMCIYLFSVKVVRLDIIGWYLNNVFDVYMYIFEFIYNMFCLF